MNICLEGGRESSLSCSFWWDSFFPLLGLSNTCSYITFSLVTDSTQSGIWRWNIEKSDWKKTQTKRNHCCTIQLNIFIHSNDIYISWFGLGKGINIGLIWKIKKLFPIVIWYQKKVPIKLWLFISFLGYFYDILYQATSCKHWRKSAFRPYQSTPALCRGRKTYDIHSNIQFVISLSNRSSHLLQFCYYRYQTHR